MHVHFTFGNIFSNDTECGVLNAEKPQDYGNVGMRQGDRGKRCSQNWNEWFWRSRLGKIWCSMGMPGEHFPLACLESSAPSDPPGPNERGGNAVVASYASIASKADLLAADAARDIILCGRSLHVDAQVARTWHPPAHTNQLRRRISCWKSCLASLASRRTTICSM